MCISFAEHKMSLEHQLPVIMKKTQMNGDRGGSQCGLTSLLPMSCRGRAAAFARDLHSRLRNLGTVQDGECESTWLTRENSNHIPTSSNAKEHETFYDFEVECGSPSSPVEEINITFPEKSTEDIELPFYDVDSDLDVKESPKLLLKEPDRGKNGFTFSTAFYIPESPVKHQSTKENGHSDKPLYTPITFEGCARQSSCDEVDFPRSPILFNQDRISLPGNYSVILDSDSEFDSAKSNPSESIEDISICENKEEIDVPVTVENLTVNGSESINGETFPTDCLVENHNEENKREDITQNDTKIITSDHLAEKEPSPAPEIDATLSTETKQEDKEDEVEGEDDRPQRVRRCSSLKTGKTPPGTPGRKKIVRFADVLGLDLADVKTFMDEIPVIPKSAYDDLAGCDVQSSPPTRPTPRYGALTLVPLFQLPRDVTEKLERYNVCLESSRVCDGVHVTICGSVRVRNLDFHKTVHIRYTMNRWKTFADLQATYVQGTCDGYSDRFQFVLYAPCISSGQRLEIAVRFQCKGQQFWDNNCGANYCFDCLALGTVTTSSLTSSAPAALHPTVDWHPSFY